MRILLIVALQVIAFGNAMTQSCQRPFGVTFSSIGRETLTVQWLQSGSADVIGYQVAYGFEDGGIGSTLISDTILSRSYIIQDLTPSTQYEVYVRALCVDGGDSGWNGPFDFTTLLTNPTQCGTALAISDDNCSVGGETFYIEIEDEGFLGFDIFLESVELILEHGWLADLQIIIENPQGAKAFLTEFIGPGNDNFGVNDGTCEQVTRFSSNACTSLSEGSPPYLGTYIPLSSLAELNDGSSSKGLWKLHICDRSPGDKGVLAYINLNLTTQICEPIDEFFISDIRDRSVQLNWNAPFNCESLIVEYGPAGFVQGSGEGNTFQINCKLGTNTINGLDPQQAYDFYLIGDCIISQSAPSCKSVFLTNCPLPSTMVDFDQLSACENNCITSCSLAGPWANTTDDDTDWIIWNGPTETDNTGPAADVNSRGNYIYVESNVNVCGEQNRAILSSSCIAVGSDPGCGLTFYLHMEGQDQGELTVNISNDDKNSFEQVMAITHTEGWQLIEVDLTNYINQQINIDIIAITGSGPESDIAIDEILLHNTSDYIASLIYLDNDNDGYGQTDSVITYCGITPQGYSFNSGDCNDDLATINPAASEILCNGKDENCNGLLDDNPSPPEVLVTLNQSESCFGLKDGALKIDINDDSNYSIRWNTGAVGDSLSNLASGFYRATITDDNSCSIATPFIEVKAESKIDIELEYLNNSTCNGRRDGSLKIKPIGGVPPYNYNWNINQIQATIIGLIEGEYSVTVTDAEGCIKTAGPFSIGVANPLNVTDTLKKDVSCTGANDGEVGIAVPNGVLPITYEWQDGYSFPNRNNLEPGEYTVTITDRIGCKDIHEFHINEPDSLQQVLLSVEPITCAGDRNGIITTKTFGGTPPFEYHWNNGSRMDDLVRLGAGPYSLTVTDANLCQFVLDTIHLSDPAPLSIQLDSIKGTRCEQSPDGYIGLSVTGGTPPLDYFWRNATGDTTIQANIVATLK